MWEQRPPLLPSQFADKTHASRQTISRILNNDMAPDPAMLLQFAKAMGVRASTLFQLAGYTTANEPIYTHEEAWEMVRDAIAASPALDAPTRATLLDGIARIRAVEVAVPAQESPHQESAEVSDTTSIATDDDVDMEE